MSTWNTIFTLANPAAGTLPSNSNLAVDTVADTDGVMMFITSLGCVASRTRFPILCFS
ncbi:hypothetical protein JW905_06100 [bacterium]|nr:hypothetical protein [candidate division CSSED10-310 bacterium]